MNDRLIPLVDVVPCGTAQRPRLALGGNPTWHALHMVGVQLHRETAEPRHTNTKTRQEYMELRCESYGTQAL